MVRFAKFLPAAALAVAGLAFSLAPALSATADATRKVALVIGNSAYSHAAKLPNPVNDARAMAAALRGIGFDVIEGLDLTKPAMVSAIDRFTEKAYGADVGLVYYAGHGLQVDAKNYLVPVDSELMSPAHLRTRTISVDDIVAALPADPNVGIVILDACRDNPLARSLAARLPASRSAAVTSGLAPVQVQARGDGTGGMLIAYATDPGSVALDGDGTVNSPYTQALLKHLATPGLELQSALTRVRGDVAVATDGRQRPWHNASLGREIFLAGAAPTKVASLPSAAVTDAGDDADRTSVAATAQGPSRWAIEQRFWDEASRHNTVPHYEAYLQQFPNGKFASIAHLNIDSLKAKSPAAAPSEGSQVRTAIAIPESVKTTPGTVLSENAMSMNTTQRIDMQLRLTALGYDTGGTKGSIGPMTRAAIGGWQKANGIIETQMLTAEQLHYLKLQTEPMMAAIHERRRLEAERSRQRSAKRRETNRRSTKNARRNNKANTAAGQQFGNAMMGFVGGIVACKVSGACR